MGREIAENFARVRERISQASFRAGRREAEVCLIAVTKTVEPERVFAAIQAGATHLGENYVQEARAKIPEVNAAVTAAHGTLPEWHLIGHLQSNKARYSVGLFSLIQSVDSMILVQEISKQAVKRNEIQSILVEVNLAGDAGRAGVAVGEAHVLAEQIALLPNISLRGLMGIAPATTSPEEARPSFRTLYQLWEQLPTTNRHILSMGMSNDFETAIEEGATHVRIGTALFGARKA